MEPETRVPHCCTDTSLPLYQLCFPINDNEVAKFEIDKEKGRFHVVGWVENHLSDHELGSELPYIQTPQCAESEDYLATKDHCHVQGDGTCCPQTHVVFQSHCVCKNVHTVKAMLEELEQRELRMQLISNNSRGKTPLILAAMEGHLDVVEFLIENGADVDAKDYAGRTALMEAALWCQWTVAKHLIKIGADIDVADVRGHTASDYAENTLLNEDLRRKHSPLRSQTHEQLWKNNFHRQVIFQTLRSLRPTKTIPKITPNSQPNEIHRQFRRLEKSFDLVLVQPVAQWSLSTEFKTVAIMIRGDPYPQVSSHSGWAHETTKTTQSGGIRVLAGKEWTKKVLELSELISYSLEEEPKKDHGRPGQCSASHAEKQLMAYFVEKHVFLPHEKTVGHELQELSLIEPKCSLRRADILVSKAACDDCEGFRKKLAAVLDIDFKLHAIPSPRGTQEEKNLLHRVEFSG